MTDMKIHGFEDMEIVEVYVTFVKEENVGLVVERCTVT